MGSGQLKKELERVKTPTVHLTQSPVPQSAATGPSAHATAGPRIIQAYDLPSAVQAPLPRATSRAPRPPYRRPLRCFLCDEEGHFVASCPLKAQLQLLGRQNQSPHTMRALPAPPTEEDSPSISLNSDRGPSRPQ